MILTYYTFFFFFSILPDEINGAWYRWFPYSDATQNRPHSTSRWCIPLLPLGRSLHMVSNSVAGIMLFVVYHQTLLYGVYYCYSPCVACEQTVWLYIAYATTACHRACCTYTATGFYTSSRTTTIRGSLTPPAKNKQIILLPIINLFTFVVRSLSLFSSSALLHYSYYYLVTSIT